MSTEKTVYIVNGMKCEGCVAAVKDALAHLPGIVETEVDLDAGTATVVGNVDPDTVSQALTNIGYPTTAREG